MTRQKIVITLMLVSVLALTFAKDTQAKSDSVETLARELVIEYRNVGLFSSSGGLTFQVVFFENSSDILFNYLNVDLSGNRGNGKSASVGVQTSQSQAMQFSCNAPKLTNNMALRFAQMP